MIVKNEEDWIEGALESVKSAVDEIILGDTGCTDRTIELAQRFSPKVLRFQWSDDFAEARNHTLAEARHPWILVLDADERVARQDLPILREAMQQGRDGFHLIQRNYVLGNQIFGWIPNDGKYAEGNGHAGYVDNPLIRFFRNDPELRFRGTVHEIIDPTRLPKKFRFGTLPLVLHHYGKVRDAERVAAKQRHYLTLGQKKIQQEPANAKAYFDLGIQHQELQQHAKAAACFQIAFSLNKLPIALLYHAISEKHQGHHPEALTLLDRALQSGLETFDVHLERGNTLLALGRHGEARREYRTAQKLNPKNPIAAFNEGLALRKLNNTKAAVERYELALKLDPRFDQAAVELATLLGAAGEHKKAAELLEPLVTRRPDYREAKLTLAKMFIVLNRAADATKLLHDCASDDDAVARSLLGAACLQQGDLDAAERHLDFALRKDRSLIDVRINLASVYDKRGDAGKAARFRLAAAAALQQATKPELQETRPEA